MAPDDGRPGRQEDGGPADLTARVVRLTRGAARDLTGVRAWFSQPGAGATAAGRLQHIARAIEDLAEHPCRHPRERDRREFSVERHRVIYRVIPDTGRDATAGDVLVLRVFGAGQSRDRL